MPDHSPRVRHLVAQVEADPASIGVLSCGEQLVVGIVLGRLDLIKKGGMKTLQQARDHIGDDWWLAAQRVSRERR